MKRILYITIILCVSAVLGNAQSHKPSAAVKAAFDKGQFRKAIDLDPNYYAAHLRYATETEAAKPQYMQWAKEHPDKAGYQYALGIINIHSDMALSEQHFLKAVALDQHCADAYSMLAVIAECRGDKAGQLKYLQSAAAAEPDNPEYASSYAGSVRQSDPARYKELMEQLVSRFPTSMEAVFALGELARAAPTAAERITYLERVRHAPEGRKMRGCMQDLLNEYAASDPAKAIALAKEFARSEPAVWTKELARQRKLFRAQQLLAGKKYLAASAMLDTVKSNWRDADRLALMKAKALDGQRQTSRAYAALSKFVAVSPSDENLPVLLRYAAKLGKDRTQVKSDLFGLLSAKAHPLADFSLEGFGANAGKKLTLADFKGKVVLLNFWYPG